MESCLPRGFGICALLQLMPSSGDPEACFKHFRDPLLVWPANSSDSFTTVSKMVYLWTINNMVKKKKNLKK